VRAGEPSGSSLAESEPNESAPIHLERLSNGATFVHQERPGAGTFAASILARGGSHEDPADMDGLTGLLASLLLRGTEQRTASEQALEVERTGSRYWATGGWWGIVIQGSGPSPAFGEVFDVIADAALHPLLDPADLAKEVSLTRQSIRSSMDRPSSALWRAARPLIFGDHPLGRVADPERYLTGIDVEALRSARQERVVGKRLVIVVVGEVSRAVARMRVESAFAGLPEGRPAPVTFEPPEPLAEEVRARVKRRTSQAEILVVLPSGRLSEEDSPVRDLLAHILGGFQERLSTEIREKRGWAYWVRTSDWRSPSGGLFGIHTAVPKKHLKEAERIIREELRRIATEPPAQDEVDRARRFLLTARARGWQTSAARAGSFLYAVARGETPRTLDEQAARYEAVTPEAIRDHARRLLDSSKLAIVTLR
jgi:zinc protease